MFCDAKQNRLAKWKLLMLEVEKERGRLAQTKKGGTTERSRAMTTLQDNEERVRLTLDTALDAVITMDSAGVVTTWNREAEKTFGWTRQEIIGQKLSGTLAGRAPQSASQLTGGQQKRFPDADWRRFTLYVCVVGWLVAVSLDAGQAQSTEDITSFRQFYNLSHAEALKGRSVRLKGTVLCYDRDWNQMFLHDGRDAGYINPQNLGTQSRFGQQVEITGATTVVEGNLAWTNLNLAILGSGTLPAAKRLALPQLASASGQWIETSGRVRVAETSRGRLGLLLHETGGNCLVYVMGLPGTNDFKWLLDCKVRVRGINASKVVNGRLDSASIMAPGISEVTILEPQRTNPFQTPAVSIGGLLNRELGPWTNNRVRISGLVSTYQPGQFLIVKDPTGVIRAQVVQVDQVLPDERVDVWGFLAASSDGIGLNDAYFTVVQPPPRSIASPSFPRSPSRTNLPGVLTNVSDILKLRRDEASESIPVRLRGVMIYADAEWGTGFFQDQGGAVFVQLHQKDVRPGQWVELTGQTGPGGFAPQVNNSAIQVLGMTNLPTPARVDLTDLSNGQLDAHWIEMEGIVRGVTGQWGRLYLSVMTRKGRFKVLLSGFEGQAVPKHLIDARVSIQGACGSELNARGQLSGITLHVPSLEQIRILDPAPTDPFTAETTRIEAVATFDPDRLTGRRVKVSGVITLRIPGQGFFLQDASGGIRVQTQQTNEVHAGELVEVLGFPVMGDFSPALDEAIFTTKGSGSLPVPAKLTAEHILLHGTNDGVVVEMEARLLQDVPHSANPELVLQDGQIIFRVQIETPTQSGAIRALQSGSLLRVTGVCTIEGSERHEPKAFRLRLRQPDDIELLEAPPWWSSRHTFMLAGGMVVLIAAALAWAGLLRRQVRAQTEVIQRKLEEGKEFAASLAREKNLLATLIDHLPDIVFIKDREGRFLLTNRAHTQFHGAASKEHFPGKSPFELFPPEVARIFAETDRKVIEEGIHLFDNEQSLKDANGNLRWVSITKVPLRDGSGDVIGLVGIGRDVTERKRADAELEKLHKTLMDASRQAGMAEVATGVLHNVGNVLNSVNVASSCLGDSLRRSKAANLSKVVALLREHKADLGTFLTSDPKGKQVPGYLAKLSEHLDGEQAAALTELAQLQKNIEHIKEIVTMQQGFAKVSGVMETLPVTELLEDALRINSAALARHDIQVIKKFDEVPPITVDKHKVLQILVNLVTNAKHACDNSGRPEKKLILRVTNGNDRVRIAVNDNGVGILPENLIRIFSHGFTTKKDGHGFGLHSGALAAKEMGGSLTVESDGPGQGATFTLELPLNEAEGNITSSFGTDEKQNKAKL